MRKTKLLALLLVVAMVASMVVPGVSAAEEYTLSVTDADGATTINAKAGDVIELYVSLSNNPGVSCVAYTMIAPEGWTVDETEDLMLFSTQGSREEKATTSYSDGRNGTYHLWLMAQGSKNGKLPKQEGEMLWLSYKIPEDAISGTYTIIPQVDADNNFFYNVDADGYIVANSGNTPLNPAVEGISVVVEGVEPEVPAADPCEKCGEVEWTEIAEGTWTGGALTDGHYKLTGNQTLSAALTVGSSTTQVCIDLNGYTITAGGAHRTITNSGRLAIMDSSENKTGAIVAYAEPYTNSGANIYTETGVLDIYGGTITGGKTAALTNGHAPSSSDYKTGGNIYIYSGTVNVYGGTITGGQARRGGNVFLNNGTFNMYDGTITAGNADRGGNVYSDGTFNMYGGTVSNGVGGWGGANLFVYGGGNTVNIYGGQILDGACKDEGGNAIGSVYGGIYIYGGLISNVNGVSPAGKARTRLINSSGSASSGLAKTYIYGGTLVGTMSLAASNSENVVYNGSFTTDVSNYLASCACMQVDGTNYTVWNHGNCTDCGLAAALAADAANDAYAITLETGEHTPAVSETSSTGYACAYCGTEVAAPSNGKEGTCANHGTVTWLPWDGAATNGHYFLEEDMTLNAQVNVASGETFCLDLNGKTISIVDGKRMFEVNSGATFNLMDNAEGGKLVGATTTTTSGAVIRTYGATNIYSGTIVGGTVSVNSTDNYYAGAIYVASGTFNMYGGTITGGKVLNPNTGSASGGNLYLTGGSVSVISGGIIENGQCDTWGGNISVNTGAQVTITGNVIIRNGSAPNGENIYVRGEKDNTPSRLEIHAGVVIEAGADPEIADVAVNTNPAELAIYAGVTLPESCLAFVVYEAERYDAAAGYYKTYEKLTDALAAAVAGDKVLMAKDAEATTVTVKPGVTLELNGKTLTATEVSAAFTGTQVLDSVGTGKIISESVAFAADNKQLPVKVDGAIILENIKFKTQYTEEGNKAVFKFYVDSAADQTQIDDAILAGEAVSLEVAVTWMNAAGEEKAKTFTLGAELLAQLAADWDNKVVVLTINMTNVELLSCTAQVVSCDVTV